MSVNFFDPHHPFDPPQEYLDRYESIEMPLPAYKPGELDDKPEFQRIDHQGAYGGAGLSFADTTDQEHQRITAAYYAMIENVDANLGRMLDYLEDSGEAENTIVIFMSDHGEMLGDHGIYLKGPYMYDAVTRVPLVVSFPARYRGGIKNDALVELVDLAPTLMEAAGLEIPRGMQGKSLDSLCRGMAEWEDHRQNVYCEYFNAMPEHRNPLPFLASVRDREYKVVVYADAEYGELYDLTQDPGEHHNLWNHPGYQDVRASYVKKCLDRILLATDPLPERTAKF
jgi:arylsulfatase A-like enzyme